ncbi:MAG TPA: hypothetical protein PKZ76_02195 [Xanthomonadaceae bacterium]|nr:hypothetical protein [Xanthomonadaceae bacterium]
MRPLLQGPRQFGGENLRIACIDDGAGMQILVEIIEAFSDLEEPVDEIFMASTELFNVKEAGVRHAHATVRDGRILGLHRRARRR